MKLVPLTHWEPAGSQRTPAGVVGPEKPIVVAHARDAKIMDSSDDFNQIDNSITFPVNLADSKLATTVLNRCN